MVRLGQRFEPDPGKQRLYAERFERYRSFARAMVKMMRKRSVMSILCDTHSDLRND